MISNRLRIVARGFGLASLGLLSYTSSLHAQQHYTQTNLVADTPGVAAVTDPNLVNPWGLSRSSGSPWWISDNGPGVSSLYDGTGKIVPLVVTIPPANGGNSSGTPTGQVFNGSTGFEVTPNNPALFIFVTEDGTVSGWNPNANPTSAITKVNTKGHGVFKGVALGTVEFSPNHHANYLYVADFRKGRIRVYDSSFHPVPLLEEAFEVEHRGRSSEDDHHGGGSREEHHNSGYAPFNIQNIGGNLYVAYAKQDSKKHDEVDGAGLGFVNVFSATGRFIQRLEGGPWFNAPWGLAQASSDFGVYSHDILVGQFGSGQISVFDPITGRYKGQLLDSTNAPITIDGLWGLQFGNGLGAGPATTLFFTAGPNHEQNGLFGSIAAVENSLGGDN